jgi:hypothetical protein
MPSAGRSESPGGPHVCNPIALAHNVHRVAHFSSSHSHRLADNHPDIIHLARFRRLAPRVQFPKCLRVRGEDRGCHLTTLFGTTTLPIVAAIDVPAAPAAPKKHGWLPLLVVLFLISYGLMTMLIVEQGRTIESQRTLIRELFRDSTELSAARKAAQEIAPSTSARTQAQIPSSTQHPSTQIPSTQHPSSQTPSTQTPSAQTPSTQAQTSQTPSSQAGSQPAGPQHRAQSQSAKEKPEFRMPSKPAADLVDDVRTQITI